MAPSRPARYRGIKRDLLDQFDEHTAALIDALSEARAARQSLDRLLCLVEQSCDELAGSDAA